MRWGLLLHDGIRQTEIHRERDGDCSDRIKPATGINPKKLMPTTAETRPRKCAGACSCTMVFARPKFIESAMAIAPMAHAVSKKLCDTDMRKTPAAMARTFPLMNFKRFS